MNLVLDASATLGLIFERAQANERAIVARLLDESLSWHVLVPPLWHIEVANGLLVGVRRGLLPEALALSFLQYLHRLPITTDKNDPKVLGRQALMRAQMSGLTAYDACYLDLALREGAVLATFDWQLQMAARVAGVPLLE